jgi:hypothetical protein
MLKLKELKVKIKSLAAEAKIIRLEETRSKGSQRQSLYFHRIYDVRQEARLSQLAYAFLRGREYSQVESKNSKLVNWDRLIKLVEKFGIFYFYVDSRKEYDRLLLEQQTSLRKWIELAKLYRAT